MDAKQLSFFIITSFVRGLPEFIVIVVGIVTCYSRMQQSPKAAKTALGGLFALLFAALFGTGLSILFAFLPLWYRDSPNLIGYVGFASGIIFSIVRAVGLWRIIYAVWVERNDRFVTG